MIIAMLLMKVTVLFALALICLPLMRGATASMRHLVCVIGLSGALLLPLALIVAPKAISVQVPVVFVSTVAAVTSAGQQQFPLANMLLAIWAIGVIVLLARLAFGFRRISQILRTTERFAEQAPVFLADVPVPLICGLFRTAILLPRTSVDWPDSQRTAAIRHELAHLQRKDLWTNLMGHVACAVYWFHPLAWALARQLREEQEEACDDAVLSAGFEPAVYAEALLATARQVTGRQASLIGCQMLRGQSLKCRIERLLDFSLPRRASAAARGRTLALSLSVLVVIGLIYGKPAPLPQAEKSYRMGLGIAAPKVIRKVDPQYTNEARIAKITGAVMLAIVVGSDGLAHDIKVLSTPDSGLGIKAMEAVRQWKFQPGRKDGKPVAVKAQVEVNFKLL